MNKEVLIRIFVGVVVGIILGAGGAFFNLHSRVIKLESQVENLQNENSTQSKELKESSSETSSPTNKNPEELISIIQDEQRNNVKESCRTDSYENFTEDDLKNFKSNRVIDQIVSKLKKDLQFLDVVLAIRKMNLREQNKILISADKPLHRTWNELNKISCEGQTQAGQDAEKIIASGIVNLVKELLRLTDDKFDELYIQ